MLHHLEALPFERKVGEKAVSGNMIRLLVSSSCPLHSFLTSPLLDSPTFKCGQRDRPKLVILASFYCCVLKILVFLLKAQNMFILLILLIGHKRVLFPLKLY